MNKTLKPDEAFTKLNAERDHINNQISLLKNGWKSDHARAQRLQRTADDLDKRISEYGLGDPKGPR